MKANDIITWRNKFSKLFCLFIIACYMSNVNDLLGQDFLNGSFEINSGSLGQDYLNLSNNQFNNIITHCYSFGNSNANIDLNSDNFFGGSAQNGNWYIGLTSSDSLSLELSDSIMAGQEYKLTFYDSSIKSIGSTKVIIGISNVKNKFGTIIFQGEETEQSEANTIATWRLEYFTFIAPVTAKFITVTINNSNWAKIDNFCLSQNEYCVDLPKFKMPNVFTPNNDGINDTFKPIVFKGMKSGHLVLLNRWGQIVYETNDLQIGWNGQINGNTASDGVYFWKVEYTTIFDESKIEFGYLTLFN